MFPRVTAILVVQHGGDHLRDEPSTPSRRRRRAPDALVVVARAARPATREAVASARPSHVVQVEERMPFGEAVRAAERLLDAPASDADSLWLLARGHARRSPGRSRALVATLEIAKSVAVAGPEARWTGTSPRGSSPSAETITRFGAQRPARRGRARPGPARRH